MKGFKVCLDCDRGIKKGIAAHTFEDLKAKIAIKFELQFSKKKTTNWNCLKALTDVWNTKLKGYHIFLDDGTEVDDEDYFKILPPQCLLIVCEKSKLSNYTKIESSKHHFKGDTALVNPYEDLLKIIRWQGGAAEVVEKIRSMFMLENDSNSLCSDEKEILLQRWKSMIEYVQSTNDHKLTLLSKREDHPDWFRDISTNAKTKEEYLSKGCQARIRGYLSKARTQLFATKFDVLLDNRKNDEKHVSSGLINGLNNSCRRPRRKIIPTGNQRRNKYSEKQAKYEEVETSDEEAWDEIDATLLQNYRDSIPYSLDELDASSDASILAASLVEETIIHFQRKLKENKYHGYLFDRSKANNPSLVDVSESSICDKIGIFNCEGKYNDDEGCVYNRVDVSQDKEGQLYNLIHSINPYESSESRILFSTWNLDHVIERSRSIIPCLIKAIIMLTMEGETDVQLETPIKHNGHHKATINNHITNRNIMEKKRKCVKSLSSKMTQKRKKLNKDYFYDLLFTRKNLKLVHIVCHDKQEHFNKKCDESQIFVK